MSEAPETFRLAVEALRSVRPRSELQVEEVRPPKRLAPWAFALGAEVTGPAGEIGTGRLVLLHQPDPPAAWDGDLRVVIYVRADVDAELATDPLLPHVGWSWLCDALDSSAADYIGLGGTVTTTSSARFGELSGEGETHDLELRASWTATSTRLGEHGEAFCTLLASTTGLPPIGVAMFGQP